MVKNNISKEKDSVLALIILALLLSLFFRNKIFVYAGIAIAGGSILSLVVTNWLHIF
ncbi:MAG: hypothetical protein M3015_13000 [Bacteroidota bacterium]|nr:hypothetical protein [Bacteroidota bacterium]